ncbi:MAG: hypothetical protein ACKV2Q_24980 [Planctomycetaceae bacterium]
MRKLWVCLAAVGLLGCDDFDKAMDGPGREKLVAPGGMGTGGDISDVANAGRAAPAANPQPAVNPAAVPEAAPAKPSGSIIGKTTRAIVDLAEAKKNPNLVEVDNKITGSDPLTASFNAYVSVTSRATALNFKHQMDILKATNDDKYPTFKEAEKLMKQLNLELAALPPYQMYGYDAKTGGIVVLEDKTEKIRLYKVNNIPIEEADKAFDKP